MKEPRERTGTTIFEPHISHLSADDRYRILIESSFDWEFWHLPDGTYEYVSPACLKVTGYAPQEFMDNPKLYYDIVHPEDYPKVHAHRCNPGTGRFTTFEFRIIRKDGQIRWIDHICQRIKDDQSHFMGCRGVNRDITSKKRAEDLYRKQNKVAHENSNLLAAIIDCTPVGIMVVDTNLRVRLITKRGCELEGRTREELDWVSTDIFGIYHPDGTPAKTEEFSITRALSGEEVKDEEWMMTRFGEKITILCNAGPIFDQEGSITGGVMVWQNITERKRSEQILEQSRRRLIDLKEQLENKNKEMESLIGVVSHDLRSPIVSIQGFSKEIELSLNDARKIHAAIAAGMPQTDAKKMQRICDVDIPEAISYIQKSAAAMDQLVKTLVKVSRAGMAELNPEMVNMDELVSNIAGATGFAIKEAGIDFESEPLPDCFADAQQVTQIFSNLIDNAIKYRDKNKSSYIRVFGLPIDDLCCYFVEDNGVGIPPEYHDRVFTLFDRVPGQQGTGEGIGLAMVKRMAERNGGRVGVESEPGQWTRFKVCLPTSNPEA